MEKITDKQLKKLWYKFFESHGFKKINNSSLIPENDPSVLFTTAGMHPLVPYLLGEKHPMGTKLYNVQRCIRTGDIDEVGDAGHLTFFEMLGNWTMGTCDKEEMIKLSYEFLTSPEYLNIPNDRLSVTVFEGDETAPKDTLAEDTWRKCGINEVYYNGKEDNWWGLASGVGPCGPDTEMFYDTGKEKCGPNCRPGCHCGKYMEIWNDVFMQYKIDAVGEKAKKLDNPNIDTGMGVERAVLAINGLNTVYDAGILKDVVDLLVSKAEAEYNENTKKSFRVICDHLRSAIFVLGDEKGVLPSNIGNGYILRRFIRRSVNHARKIGLDTKCFDDVVNMFLDYYKDDYEHIYNKADYIKAELSNEVDKFAKAIDEGHKEFEKVINGIEKHKLFAKEGEVVENVISGKAAFRLYDTFGFPVELTLELAEERGYTVDVDGFKKAYEEHQEKSRSASAGTFKGGLSDDSYTTTCLHTATHIMLAGLRQMFGTDTEQKGSNITPERLRFDFNCDHKMTPEELKQLEDFVNDAISKEIEVEKLSMTFKEALDLGAYGIHNANENDLVSVYKIGDVDLQICGGPHAKNTKDLHHFKIMKEESSSSGIRRIKAKLD
ncbi:MAG: alanine--tRNA ligase [Clostridia bacterium]|nr:alanine--tRNA ligase [Clostridia bacterium]